MTTMANPFAQMHAAYPPDGKREAYDPKRFDKFADKVPAQLAEEWRSTGFGSYGGGLVWLVPPDTPILNRRDWDFLDGTGVDVLRTAFGNVCVWQGNQFIWLNEHTGKLGRFPANPRILLNFTLTGSGFRENVLMESLFLKARSTLGDIGPDDCFGFAPLPALGGAIEEQYLIKTNLREYVALAGDVLKA
jgi:hypothetical protein